MMTDSSPIVSENYPSEWVTVFTLRGGQNVTVRPIRPDDAPRLQEGFTHLSTDSKYYRFLDSTKELTDDLVQRLSILDYQERMAFVGEITEADEIRLVGVARYALIGAEDPGTAETAVVVRDDCQGQGLGTYLYIQLIHYAQQHGVKSFVATVHQSNARIINFIRRSKLPFDRQVLEPGVLLIRIHLIA